MVIGTVFLLGITSVDFTLNALLSTEKLNVVFCVNTFLKKTDAEFAPTFINIGPCGFGGTQCPINGQI